MLRSFVIIGSAALLSLGPINRPFYENPSREISSTVSVQFVAPLQSPADNEFAQYVHNSTASSFHAKAPFDITTCTWIGPSTGDWEVAGNWSCNQIPTLNNDVEIFVGTVTLNTDAEVHSLKVGQFGGLIVSAGKRLAVNH